MGLWAETRRILPGEFLENSGSRGKTKKVHQTKNNWYIPILYHEASPLPPKLICNFECSIRHSIEFSFCVQNGFNLKTESFRNFLPLPHYLNNWFFYISTIQVQNVCFHVLTFLIRQPYISQQEKCKDL